MVNRTQALVLGFLLVALTSVLAIRVVAPEVYDLALRLPADERQWQSAFLGALALLILLLCVGVVRRWRWIFWVITVAFLAGVLRVPAAVLQLTGVLASDAPAWYLVYQGLLGMAQFAIGLAMVAAYRRAGVWGAPAAHR
jgi:hypothetical protein